jgi:kindlin 2
MNSSIYFILMTDIKFVLLLLTFLFDSYIGIRHPEELSFCKPLEPNHLNYNLKDLPAKKKIENQKNGYYVAADTNTFIAATQSPQGSTGSLDQLNPFMCAPVAPNNHKNNHSSPINSPVTVHMHLYFLSD